MRRTRSKRPSLNKAIFGRLSASDIGVSGERVEECGMRLGDRRGAWHERGRREKKATLAEVRVVGMRRNAQTFFATCQQFGSVFSTVFSIHFALSPNRFTILLPSFHTESVFCANGPAATPSPPELKLETHTQQHTNRSAQSMHLANNCANVAVVCFCLRTALSLSLSSFSMRFNFNQ